MRTLSMRFLKLTSPALLSLALLSACATQDDSTIIKAEAPASQEVQSEEIAPPALPSLRFTWPLGEGTLIAPPIAIQRDAIEACRLRGYDTSYMVNVGIDGDSAVGVFGCRGAD